MQYVECPKEYDGTGKSIFLGGGITGCGNWQCDMIRLLSHTDLTLINPRRASFDEDDDSCSIFQIEWEYRHLNKADAVMFWFPPETLCPITLYELGARCMTDVKLFVGVHPHYKRKLDVEQQLKHIRPDIDIVQSYGSLALQVSEWA